MNRSDPAARTPSADLPPDKRLVAARFVVILGCQPVLRDGRLVGALGRRVAAGRRVYAETHRQDECPGWLVVSGGRTWEGVVEADAMREELLRDGVAPAAILRERCSLSTHDNAVRSAQLLERFLRSGADPVALVTCDWHMPRAAALFRRTGLTVVPVPVPGPEVAPPKRWARTGHEWISGLRYARRGGLS